jgi:hypothetical protein
VCTACCADFYFLILQLLADFDLATRHEALQFVCTATSFILAPLGNTCDRPHELLGYSFCTHPATSALVGRLAVLSEGQLGQLDIVQESFENKLLAIQSLLHIAHGGDQCTAHWQAASVLKTLANNLSAIPAAKCSVVRGGGKVGVQPEAGETPVHNLFASVIDSFPPM